MACFLLGLTNLPRPLIIARLPFSPQPVPTSQHATSTFTSLTGTESRRRLQLRRKQALVVQELQLLVRGNESAPLNNEEQVRTEGDMGTIVAVR